MRTKTASSAPAHPADLAPREQPASQLSPRQAQVLALASQGWTLSQVAERLGLSHNTVKAHLRFAYRRLGVHRRVNAINLFHAACFPRCGCDLQLSERTSNWIAE